MPRMETGRPGLRRVAGFDLGTDAGWAVLDEDGRRVASGAESVAAGRHEGPGMRPVRFRALVRRVLAEHAPALAAYELVRRHLGTEAAHVYGELRGVLREELDRAGIPYVAPEVSAMKTAATGRGNAKKADMVAAARERWGTPPPRSKRSGEPDPEAGDDEADALWVADVARAELPGA